METGFKAVYLCAIFASLAGCGRKASDLPPPAASGAKSVSVSALANATPAAEAPVAVAPQDANAAAAPAPAPVDADPPVDPGLRAALVKYFTDQMHPAESWQDLLSGRYISRIPTGADGKPLDWKKVMAAMAKAGKGSN
jgi:predicted small lipoprotein YifL